MNGKKISLFLIVLCSLCALSFTSSIPPEERYYSFIFPKQNKVILKENALSIVVEVNQSAISRATFYIPWDSTFILVLPSKTERQKYFEETFSALPQHLVLKQLVLITMPYHLSPDSLSDDFQFNQQSSAYYYLSKDSSTNISHALHQKEEMRVRLQITGWRPIATDVADRNSFCRGKYVAFSATLSPGMNIIPMEFMLVNSKQIVKDSVLAFYDVDIDGAKIPADYVKQSFHKTENENACLQCHSTETKNNERELKCASCHGGQMKQNFVHGLVASNDCFTCHKQEANSGYVPVYSSNTENEMCYTCHDGIAKIVNEKPNVHAPLAGGECSICHSPHASTNPSQLRKPINEVCLSCHDSHREGNHPVVFHPNRDVSDPRKPEKDLSCTSCHNPHASENKSMLAMPGGYFALCQSCHSK